METTNIHIPPFAKTEDVVATARPYWINALSTLMAADQATAMVDEFEALLLSQAIRTGVDEYALLGALHRGWTDMATVYALSRVVEDKAPDV